MTKKGTVTLIAALVAWHVCLGALAVTYGGVLLVLLYGSIGVTVIGLLLNVVLDSVRHPDHLQYDHSPITDGEICLTPGISDMHIDASDATATH